MDETKKTHQEVAVAGTVLRGYLDEPLHGGPHPLVIMFHGITGDATEANFLFSRLARHLATIGIACLRLSFSGSGESDGDFSETTCLDQARQGSAILDYARDLPGIDARRIALLGMSMGGLAAALVASRRQAQLRGLILLGPAFRYAEKYRALTDNGDFFWVGNLKVGRKFVDDAVATDFKGLLESLTLPVHFFHGTADTTVDPAVSLEFSRVPPRSALTLIQGTDHTFATPEGFEELLQGVEPSLREWLDLPREGGDA